MVGYNSESLTATASIWKWRNYKGIIAAEILFMVLLSSILATDIGYAQFSSNPYGNYERVYTIPVRFRNIQFTHRLYVSIPDSLYDYYRSKSSSVITLNDPAAFVTPEVVKPIAESLRKIIQDDEQFANAVLTLVHQMSYIKSDVKFPVETLVEGEGDCDVLSVLAASIMKAGGLDVVLIYYEGISPTHMNVGVYLPNTPVYHTWWMTPKYYEYKGRKYWVAESTPSRFNPRVGDQLINVEKAKARIILIENRETPPALISASLDTPLNASLITLQPQILSISNYWYILNISGAIYPPLPSESVVIYVSHDGILKDFVKACTDERGSYSLICNLTPASVYYLRASWSGNSEYAGVDSETFTVLVGPKSLVQFEWNGFNCTLGRASLADYELRLGIGLKEFLETQSFRINAEGFKFSGEFLILKSNQSASPLEAEEFLTGLEGLQPLRLPDNFDSEINDKFGFVLGYNADGGYLCIKGMNDYDISEVINSERTVFWNASISIQKNTWYKITMDMFEGLVSVKLYDVNGTVLDRVNLRRDSANLEGLVIFIAEIRSTIVVFKNLCIETDRHIEGGDLSENEIVLPIICIKFLLIFVAAVIVYSLIKEKEKFNSCTRIR